MKEQPTVDLALEFQARHGFFNGDTHSARARSDWMAWKVWAQGPIISSLETNITYGYYNIKKARTAQPQKWKSPLKPPDQK